MKNRILLVFFLILLVLYNEQVLCANSDIPTKTTIKSNVQKVADWQLANFSFRTSGNLHDYGIVSWTNAVLYIGLMEWANLEDDENIYYNWLYDIGEQSNWKLNGIYPYHADEFCAGQFFAAMYAAAREEQMLADTRERIKYVMDNLPNPSMAYTNKKAWTWCDALFMAPPLYAWFAQHENDNSYLEFMDHEFRKTYNYLFDSGENLFFRDDSYFNKTEANGEKIFWGRGNGWALAGIANILKQLPEDSTFRLYYQQIFKKLALSLIKHQDEEGAWRASILDQESYPAAETSATALIAYALAYGLNNGLLTESEAALPVVKAWTKLSAAIHENGKLGWVQPIGQDPKTITAEMTAPFGVGAFLLFASELYKLAAKTENNPETGITSDQKNRLSIFNSPETVLSVYSLHGSCFGNTKLNGNSYTEALKTYNLPAGIYLVHFQKGNESTTVKYIIR